MSNPAVPLLIILPLAYILATLGWFLRQKPPWRVIGLISHTAVCAICALFLAVLDPSDWFRAVGIFWIGPVELLAYLSFTNNGKRMT